MAAFFPRDREMTRKGWECHPSPASRLAQQPLRKRFAKSHADYEERESDLRLAWPSLSAKLSEAKRFQNEFARAVQSLPAE